jgi:hypothetical protein
MRIAPSVTASASEENFSLFGLTAKQVEGSRGWYNPRWHYENEPEARAALDLIAAIISAETNPASSRPGPSTAGGIVCRPTSVDTQGGPEPCRVRQVLQRPHRCRIREGSLAGRALHYVNIQMP